MDWKYEVYYQYCDPISQSIRNRQVATTTYEVMTRVEPEQTEYYCDFLRRHDVTHGIDQYLYYDNPIIGDLRIWRQSADHVFTRREKQLLHALRPMLTNAYRTVLSGDALEAAVRGSEVMAIAISADYRRYECSPALIRWIGRQVHVNERSLKNGVMAAVMRGRSEVTHRHYHVSINWRNVASSSQCAMMCTVTPIGGTVHSMRLTPRERDVAALVARGMTDRQISDQLEISFWTVRTHVGGLLRKLGARNRVEVAYRMLRDDRL